MTTPPRNRSGRPKISNEELRQIYDVWTKEVDRKATDNITGLFETLIGMKVQSGGMCKCPFHDDNSPSMSVTNGKGFHCHKTGCDANPGGTSIKLVMMARGLDFKTAREQLASLVGIPAPNFSGYHFRPRHSGSPNLLKPAAPVQESMPAVVLGNDEMERSSLLIVPKHFSRPVVGSNFRIYGRDLEGNGRVENWRPVMSHEYRNPDGDLLSVVVRMMHNGKKTFRQIHCGRADPSAPADLQTNGWAWVKGLPAKKERKPVYGAERVREWLSIPEEKRGGILVVEGEKCVDYAVKAYNDTRVLVLSPMGGSEGNLYADWAPIAQEIMKSGTKSVRMFAWPDADNSVIRKSGLVIDPREVFVQRVINGFARDLDLIDPLPGWTMPDMIYHGVIPPADKSSGWDIADAIDEGWGKQRLNEHIRSYSVRVEPVSEIQRRFVEKTEPENGTENNDNPEPENGPEYIKKEAIDDGDGPR